LPFATTARVAEIRKEPLGTGLLPFLVSKTTNVVSRSSAGSGSPMPLSTWNSFLPQLIDDKCVVLQQDEIPDHNLRERLEVMRAQLAIVCPLNSAGGSFGALFVQWSRAADFNRETDLPIVQKTATKITAYLEIASKE
jgi:hypothetical protein